MRTTFRVSLVAGMISLFALVAEPEIREPFPRPTTKVAGQGIDRKGGFGKPDCCVHCDGCRPLNRRGFRDPIPK